MRTFGRVDGPAFDEGDMGEAAREASCVMSANDLEFEWIKF